MKKLLFTFAILFAAWGASAQPNKKIAPALTEFLNTSFMLKFQDLKLEAESMAADLAAREHELPSAELVRIRAAYNQSAQRANKMLETIKQDFLDPKKLKSIEAMPEMYSDGLHLRLLELTEFYSAHFLQAVADARGQQLHGSPMLFLVTEMISLARGLGNYFRQMQREARLYTEDYLNQHLVKPHRWRYWNEMSSPNGSMDHYSNHIQYNSAPQQPMNMHDAPMPNFDTWNSQYMQWQQQKQLQQQHAQYPPMSNSWDAHSQQGQLPVWENPTEPENPTPDPEMPSDTLSKAKRDPFAYPGMETPAKKQQAAPMSGQGTRGAPKAAVPPIKKEE